MARVLIVLLALVSACTNAETRNLDKLYEKAKFKVGGKAITAYVADDDSRRSQGLMFIEKLPADTGMLFVFENEQHLGFWMKNTLIPLAIGFFDAKGVLVDIQEMKVAATIMDATPPSYQSKSPALYALEMNAGWFSKNGIKTGSRLELVSTVKSDLLKAKLSAAKKSGQ
jgi:uncharacterized protein